jgi:hypothetical protein
VRHGIEILLKIKLDKLIFISLSGRQPVSLPSISMNMVLLLILEVKKTFEPVTKRHSGSHAYL